MKPNHKVIYLVPDDVYSWLWCDDPAPAPGMVEDEAIKYIRADQADKEIEQLKKDKTEMLEALNGIIKEKGVGQTGVTFQNWSDMKEKFRAIANAHANED